MVGKFFGPPKNRRIRRASNEARKVFLTRSHYDRVTRFEEPARLRGLKEALERKLEYLYGQLARAGSPGRVEFVENSIHHNEEGLRECQEALSQL